MKTRIFKFFAIVASFLAVLPFTACKDNGGDSDEPSAYSADVKLDKVNFVNVSTIGTSAYRIDLSLTNSAYELNLSCGCPVDELAAGDYAYRATADGLSDGQATMELNVYGRKYDLQNPSLKVSLSGGAYKIVFEATVNVKDRIRLTFEGPISFRPEVGPQGLLLRDQLLPSTLMGDKMLYTVYLPPSWDGKKTFPVLYLLHGATNFGATGHNDWVDGANFHNKLAAMIADGTACEMVVIMPNCCVNGENLFYCDNYQGGKYPYMSYFFNELVPTLEEKYCIVPDRDHRVVSGLSMGGYGSLYFGALHPEMFSYIYACSPATWLDGAPNIFDLFGNDLKQGATLPGITIEIGTSDFLFSSAEMLKNYLVAAGVDIEYITRDGAHDWNFWNVCAPKIITRATAAFSPN